MARKNFEKKIFLNKQFILLNNKYEIMIEYFQF